MINRPLFAMIVVLLFLVACENTVTYSPHSTGIEGTWSIPSPTANLTRAYHPAYGTFLYDSIPSNKEIIQRMNARLECLDGSRAERIDVVVGENCADCYEEWVIDCQNDNQFLVVVSEETSRGGFFLFEGRPFQ